MKKALSLLLAVLMVFTLLPVSALADGETPGTAEPTTKAETTPTPEETPIPEGTPEPEETPTPERTPEPEETLTPEDTPEPEDQTKYPWEDMTDEEFAAYIYAEENREYLISLMTGADEAAWHENISCRILYWRRKSNRMYFGIFSTCNRIQH